MKDEIYIFVFFFLLTKMKGGKNLTFNQMYKSNENYKEKNSCILSKSLFKIYFL